MGIRTVEGEFQRVLNTLDLPAGPGQQGTTGPVSVYSGPDVPSAGGVGVPGDWFFRYDVTSPSQRLMAIYYKDGTNSWRLEATLLDVNEILLSIPKFWVVGGVPGPSDGKDGDLWYFPATGVGGGHNFYEKIGGAWFLQGSWTSA